MAKYKVKEDDTFDSIATHLGVGANELRSWNDMAEDADIKNYVGKELNTSLKDWADETRLRTAQNIVGHPGMSADMENLYNQIKNRKDFKYDLDADALYQQYKDKYINQGRLAMEDTMGQAAALTGGYGNSYAQSVGQQAYNAQLDKLNDVIPELYQLAYDRYATEGQDLYNKYSLAADEHNRQLQVEKDKLDALNLVSPTTSSAYTDSTEDEYSATYNEIATNVYEDFKQGAKASEISEYLRGQFYLGNLTRPQYKELLEKYVGSQYSQNSAGGGSGKFTV